MEPTGIQCVRLTHDSEWGPSFTAWLEEQERKQVGVEDGAYRVTFDEGIRTALPNEFLQTCTSNHLTEVLAYTVKRFPGSPGVYHMGGTRPCQECYKNFVREASEAESYKNPTCCTQKLTEGTAAFIQHVEQDVLMSHAQMVRGAGKAGQISTSNVLLDEEAARMKLEYDTFCDNAEAYAWEASKVDRPSSCPNPTCATITDSEASDFDEKEKGTEKKRKRKGKAKGQVPAADTSTPLSDEEGRARFKNTTLCHRKSKIMYGFGKGDHMLNITDNLNMCRIFNLLWLLPFFVPGFHSSYMYIAQVHSLFSVHVEDVLTWSLNYLFHGHPKVWIIIPPWAEALLDYHLHRDGLYLAHNQCWNLLGHKVLWPAPSWLHDRGIPYKLIVQQPGDLVVLYPNVPHYGINTGPNIAQAINIGTKSWLPMALHAKQCLDFPMQIHVDIKPLLAAFRPDLLARLRKGEVPIHPTIQRGFEFLAEQTKRICFDAVEQHLDEAWGSEARKPVCQAEAPMTLQHLTCPLLSCSFQATDSETSSCKTAVIRHIRRAHRPIAESLLKDIK